MEAIQSRVESWMREQRAKIIKLSWSPLQWRMRWPPWIISDREQRKQSQLEYERRKKQLQDLCLALKADSVADLQDILCCMVLSECVYKRPASEMVRAVNRFKADFGGQVVSLERVQPSSDHVPHRYLLAEAGDTLFASFVGTKQYKDVVADVNILQGAIFHDDIVEDTAKAEAIESRQGENHKGNEENQRNSLESKPKQMKDQPKPAAHRGFLARAKGIPALELYRLAQKKNRKLVLCGHSLGGAVAALATLAILRVVAASSSLKENQKVSIKCITFSQPPVGNAALRDYVHEKGWQHYFKSYCIPEDLVPRILSPAYFHHYSAQPLSTNAEVESRNEMVPKSKGGLGKPRARELKENGREQLVLGLGPVQTSFWRLSRLVPLEGLRRQLNEYTGMQVDLTDTSSTRNPAGTSSLQDIVAEPQSLEIQEGSDGISLKPITETDSQSPDDGIAVQSTEKTNSMNGDGRNWRQVPYLPSYVPFGQVCRNDKSLRWIESHDYYNSDQWMYNDPSSLYLLMNSSVELLSGAEYSKLTSVRSVIAELRERFQSHSMKSYRSRFQRIYDMCMDDGGSSFLGMVQVPQLPHLQQWLGLAVAGAVDLAHIVESPVIRTATSIAPLGWSGFPSEKNGELLKVDITGFGLHLCTLVHAQVNGSWCSTKVESFPSTPSYSSNYGVQSELQKMRILVGAPLRRPPKHLIVADPLMPLFPSIESDAVNHNREPILTEDKNILCPEGLRDVYVFCTSDFATVSREVYVRTRRVRLLGLEGAGKTSLFKAIMGQCRQMAITNFDNMHMEADVQEGIASGICYSDAMGVNLQELNSEASRFRDELWMGIRDLRRKTDLVILVHNLSHKIPWSSNANSSQQKPVLSLLLDEAKALGIPWVLAITNKFSVSAHHQKAAIDSVLQAYQASPSTTEVVNSCPYVIPSAAASASLSWIATGGDSEVRMAAQKLMFGPINFFRRPFQKKDTILAIEGVNSLCQLVHRVLCSHEEASLEELAKDRLSVELDREHALALARSRDSKGKASSTTAATVGASIGAGLGIILAVVMGAASALRKP